MKHNILGNIEHDEFWTRKYETIFLGNIVKGELTIRGEIDEEIEKLQIEAFEQFSLNEKEIILNVEEKIFEYYCDIVEEYRDRLGESADQYAPIIKEKQELENLLEFEAVYIPYSFNEDERVVGLLFESKWEPEHGLGVKIVNEEIVELGFQDIVL